MNPRRLFICLLFSLLFAFGSPVRAQVQLSPVARQQFFSATGVPLSGGFLYTYAAGTNTLQATYTDSTGSIANSNPIVLDSTGSANIWLSTSAYKFVLYNAQMVQQWSVDNITAPITLSQILGGNNTWTGTNTFGTITATSLTATNATITNATLSASSVANAALKYASGDAAVYVSATGSDSNDGLSPGSPKATISAALTALPTCTPFPSSPATTGGATQAFSGKCGTIFLGANGSSSSAGYAVGSTVTINSVMVKIRGLGADKLSTQIQCGSTSPCIEFNGANVGGPTNSPEPVMSANGGLENLTMIGNNVSGQILVESIDGAGLTYRDLRLSNNHGTGAVCMELENDTQGESERVLQDDVAYDDCATGLLNTTTASGLTSFDHQTYRHLQFSLQNGQTAWALSQNAQFTGLIDGVINTTLPNTNTYTAISVSNSATVGPYFYALVVDNAGGGTVTYCSGCTASNFRMVGADYRDNIAWMAQDTPLEMNSTGSPAAAIIDFQHSLTSEAKLGLDSNNFLATFQGASETSILWASRGTVTLASGTASHTFATAYPVGTSLVCTLGPTATTNTYKYSVSNTAITITSSSGTDTAAVSWQCGPAVN